MPPMNEALATWHDFYALLGEASATMIGLLFVAASVGSGVFSQSQRGAVRMFLSASVVQFATILGSCLVVLAPFRHWGRSGTGRGSAGPSRRAAGSGWPTHASPGATLSPMACTAASI